MRWPGCCDSDCFAAEQSHPRGGEGLESMEWMGWDDLWSPLQRRPPIKTLQRPVSLQLFSILSEEGKTPLKTTLCDGPRRLRLSGRG